MFRPVDFPRRRFASFPHRKKHRKRFPFRRFHRCFWKLAFVKMIFCTSVIHFTTNISVRITKVKCRLAQKLFSQRFKAKKIVFFTQRNGLFPNWNGEFLNVYFSQPESLASFRDGMAPVAGDGPLLPERFSHGDRHPVMMFFRRFPADDGTPFAADSIRIVPETDGPGRRSSRNRGISPSLFPRSACIISQNTVYSFRQLKSKRKGVFK